MKADAEMVARWFHEAYERLAPEHGYKTRDESAVPWDDVPAENKALMMATASGVMRRLYVSGEVENLRERLAIHHAIERLKPNYPCIHCGGIEGMDGAGVFQMPGEK